ncbi:DUF5309 domain-containing protein [Pelagerythrobacter marinus]|uniref:DUF5309 domain-containing protein n=1 Tax=Pelagerythrobacter marinus TaxID=538382 RepID=UPI002AC984CE|nr:DUF5309 domain-containing protein [Pelagerythrobacter marinus]WPZ05494.1 DUF5309 domain-containing protein [Pelagerythrobacter marinus]
MAVPTNTVQTFSRNSIREDLTNIISNISPTDTPFMSNIGTGKAKQRLHEWQKDSLASPDGDNKTIEGDDVTADPAAATSRLNNYTQLSDKAVSVSSTARAVDNAGYADELAYQVSKRAKELKRDIETRINGNFAAVPGGAGTAGETAGSVAFMYTNVDAEATGTDPTLSGGTSGYPNAAAGAGVARAFTEAQLKNVHELAWTEGGEPTMLIMSGKLKQVASTFSGIAAQRKENTRGQATIIGAADVYVGDFGEVSFVPSRFCPTDVAQLIDPSLWKLMDLQPYQLEDLAKTGHSDKKMLSREYVLQCQNEAGNGIIRDLDPDA